ncbi:MAG: 30S ribosomal protein S9 [Spartobacteria bacterium]|nr:30S ribosomal protein S9 [Spartobacteria bacterium]
MAQHVVEYGATGRRKEAVARVRLALGVGKTFVNGREFNEYFPVDSVRNFIEEPLAITETLKRYDVIVKVAGGGSMGQAGAVRHGIARALVQADPALKDRLKANGCLTRDPRMKERKKSGQPGARKRFQFSKR